MHFVYWSYAIPTLTSAVAFILLNHGHSTALRISDKMHPYKLFHRNPAAWKCRDASCVLILCHPYTSAVAFILFKHGHSTALRLWSTDLPGYNDSTTIHAAWCWPGTYTTIINYLLCSWLYKELFLCQTFRRNQGLYIIKVYRSQRGRGHAPPILPSIIHKLDCRNWQDYTSAVWRVHLRCSLLSV